MSKGSKQRKILIPYDEWTRRYLRSLGLDKVPGADKLLERSALGTPCLSGPLAAEKPKDR